MRETKRYNLCSFLCEKCIFIETTRGSVKNIQLTKKLKKRSIIFLSIWMN